jgi:hypothetical protein
MFLYLMYLAWPPSKRVCRDKKEGGRAEGRNGGRKEEQKTGRRTGGRDKRRVFSCMVECGGEGMCVCVFRLWHGDKRHQFDSA